METRPLSLREAAVDIDHPDAGAGIHKVDASSLIDDDPGSGMRNRNCCDRIDEEGNENLPHIDRTTRPYGLLTHLTVRLRSLNESARRTTFSRP